jgi:streptogramin lyase
MRSLVPKLLIALSVALLAGAGASGAAAAPAISGTFELKSELGTNNEIVQGPDGNIWVTLSDMEKDVAKITPTGAIEEFDLGPEIQAPSGIVSAGGKLWVPTKTNGVASFLPSKPTEVEEFEIAGMNAEAALGLGPDGQIWAAVNEKVFRFPPTKPETGTEIAVPGMAPKDVEAAGSLVAIADADAEKARIVTFTTGAVPVEKDFAINGGSQGIASSPTGQIGFSEQVPKEGAAEEVGVIVPPSPAFSVKQPDDPFGAAFGNDGAFWIVRAGGAHGLARLTPTGGLSLLGGFPLGLTPRQITTGPGNTLWVTDEENMKKGVVVRISGVEPPQAPPTTTTTPPSNGVTVTTKPVPDTKLGKGLKKTFTTEARKATVRIAFSSTVAGSSFQCSLVKVPAPKKGKKKKVPKPVFAGCTSPRVLHLVPGKYRFAVRATAAGVTDASPAESAFTVVRRQQRPKHR